MMRVIIIGAGKLGYKLAESFAQGNRDVIVIDIVQQALDRINDTLDVLTIKANGVQLDALRQLNIKSTDLILAVTSSDETNMLIGSIGKKLGCEKAVARIRNPEYENQLGFIKKEMGIDYIVNPELSTAKEIAKYLLKGHAVHMEDFAMGKVSMVDFRVESLEGIAGEKIKDLEIPESMLIVAISRSGQVIIPYGDTEIQSSDIIYVMGKKESINKFSAACGAPIKRKTVKTVLILGGGKAGYHLAKKLCQHGVSVKLIERNKERCKYLADELTGVLVIHGDGTDVNILTDENISEMDALISVTGYDEENLLLALLGKQHGVDKVIAKVSRPNYVPIIEKLGIDLAVNPVLITASEILRFIQGGRVVSISLLLGGKAEVIEIIAEGDSKIVGKRLAEQDLPRGIIIGSIVHKGKLIIPNGDSIINPGDRVVVFCLQSEESSLYKFFHKGKGGLLDELWDSIKGARKSTSI
ncbi:TrkA-N domain protein [Alkaliphilus metalliredigens QYMF]|uniref:Trk system potassium uptake protein TrkA n=1 Tax=Alkaliphilus metalliredigens (strain QYMF) TaxID=293826 RepID=A6TWC0_ALKMQ|nr:Trk system potassium transporter TrkA [Alkaliphilus metalliredigens]ABR50488.1 TrkA-N domain protein [Alkaliphilus metalliredigens QYMF]